MQMASSQQSLHRLHMPLEGPIRDVESIHTSRGSIQLSTSMIVKRVAYSRSLLRPEGQILPLTESTGRYNCPDSLSPLSQRNLAESDTFVICDYDLEYPHVYQL